MGPNECKYCGCSDVLTSSEAFVHFGCGSGYWPRADQWTYANKCVGKCAARVAELEERIKRAVEVLEGAERFDVISSDGGVSRDPSDGGGEVDADIVDQVIEILKGETNGKAE